MEFIKLKNVNFDQILILLSLLCSQEILQICLFVSFEIVGQFKVAKLQIDDLFRFMQKYLRRNASNFEPYNILFKGVSCKGLDIDLLNGRIHKHIQDVVVGFALRFYALFKNNNSCWGFFFLSFLGHFFYFNQPVIDKFRFVETKGDLV